MLFVGFAFADSEEVLAFQQAGGWAFGGFVFSYTTIFLIAVALIGLMVLSSGSLQREIFTRFGRLKRVGELFLKMTIRLKSTASSESVIILRSLSLARATFMTKQPLASGTNVEMDFTTLPSLGERIVHENLFADATVSDCRAISDDYYLITVRFKPFQQQTEEKLSRLLEELSSAA